MKLGLNVPVRRDADGDSIRDFAQTAEGLGFASLWQGDHVVIPQRIESPYPYSERFDPDIKDLFPDPAFVEVCSALGYLAGCTRKVLLGTGVIVVPMRDPVLLAKQLSTLSLFSGGRIIAGIGVGWMKEEFDALSMPFDHRGARTDEAVRLMRALWSSTEAVGFSGKYYSVEPLRFRPLPVGGSVPIWVGGHTEAALKRTARYADGWYAVELSPAALEQHYQRVCELARGYGRTERIQLACATRLHIADGDMSETLALVKEYERIGVDHLIVYATTKRTAKENMVRLERVANEIMPQLATSTVA